LQPLAAWLYLCEEINCKQNQKKSITMKMKFLFFFIAIIAMLVSCNKDKEEEVKNLTPTEAKVELRNASEQISTEMTDMMNMPAFVSMDFMMQLMDNEGWKSTIHSLIFNNGKTHLHAIKDALRPATRSANEIGDYGVYEFNFLIDAFEMVESSTTMLKFIYPSDEAAYAAQQNDAEFVADNLQYLTITYDETYWDEWSQTWITETYEEILPTSANVNLKIDGATVLTATYSATYNENGNPQSISANITSAPYSFVMSMSGSGLAYSTMLSFKENTTELMGYDLDVIYTSDMSDVEKVTGYYIAAPLKIDGWMNYFAINNHMTDIEENGGNFDLAFLNSQLSMQKLVICNLKCIQIWNMEKHIQCLQLFIPMAPMNGWKISWEKKPINSAGRDNLLFNEMKSRFITGFFLYPPDSVS
jgi:hypothetical protein